ncbi:hypothetical protein Droror1_Dr00017694 [Drosera rotundifolia]
MIDEYNRVKALWFGESAKGVGSVVEMTKFGDLFIEALNGGLGVGMAGIGLRQTQVLTEQIIASPLNMLFMIYYGAVGSMVRVRFRTVIN